MMDGFSGIRLAAAHPKRRAGRKKFRETRHPVYREVRQRNSGKWVCELRRPNKSRIWLGTFPTVEMAARAHDVAAIALRGPDACLNFADSAWRLPVPDSGDTRDIQRAAAAAAEAFRPVNKKAAEESVSCGGDEAVFWMDEEEEVFRRPELLADMYNGMMLPPPVAADVACDADEEEAGVDLPLWSYTI